MRASSKDWGFGFIQYGSQLIDRRQLGGRGPAVKPESLQVSCFRAWCLVGVGKAGRALLAALLVVAGVVEGEKWEWPEAQGAFTETSGRLGLIVRKTPHRNLNPAHLLYFLRTLLCQCLNKEAKRLVGTVIPGQCRGNIPEVRQFVRTRRNARVLGPRRTVDPLLVPAFSAVRVCLPSLDSGTMDLSNPEPLRGKQL